MAFFNCREIVYQHLYQTNLLINKEYYQHVLTALWQHVRKKCPEICNTCILHEDNAHLHTATTIANYLTAHNIKVTSYLSYSSDLAPCDYWLFPTLKRHLYGQEFKTNQEVITATKNEWVC